MMTCGMLLTSTFCGTAAGDRLNFGLAVEKARVLGVKAEMVIVGDDVALTTDRHRARGVAGTVFVHKMAGAAAEAKADLDTVKKRAQEVHFPRTLH